MSSFSYMLDSCIMLWEYFQRTRPDWLDKQLRFRDWITGFILPDLQWPV
ncbi:MAG TPA: hypothetical protein VKX46_16970 [Ktedonobacteraceae bacterium]|nr:hypothetical protein [Ktedonobacteraceae bacterium]